MAKKPESRRQLRIRKALKKAVGGKWVKVHGGPFQESGLPDLIGCVQGRFFGFEVKEPNGEPTDIQLAQLEEYRNNGATAEVIETAEEAIELVERALAGTKASRRLRPKEERGRALPRARGRKDMGTPGTTRPGPKR